MKDYLELKKHYIDNHKIMPFSKMVKSAAERHGYKGFLAKTRFLTRRFIDHYLQVFARTSPYNGVRIKLQRMRGVKIGKHVQLGPLVTIDDAYPNFAIIEDGVGISGSNYILTHSKPWEYHKHVSEAYIAPTILKKNCWIGIGVIVLPGVTIGEGAIVAAGSVVTKDVPANTLYGGMPAKLIREFEMKDGIPIGFKKPPTDAHK